MIRTVAALASLAACGSPKEQDSASIATGDPDLPSHTTPSHTDTPPPTGTLPDDDADDDGYPSTDSGGADCDDHDASVNPGADEVWYDGIDEDCSGGSDYDADGDGDDVLGWGDDCDDTDATVDRGAVETWYDGIDEDCRGDDDFDQDHDGHDDPSGGGDDCDDTAPSVHPGAVDIAYDGVDADCAGDSDYDSDGDGADSSAYGGNDCDDFDASLTPFDADLDGFTSCDGDCDDADGLTWPGAVDACDDGVDQDCSGHDAVCPVDGIDGRTYVIDWNDLTFVYPASAAFIATADAILLQADTYDTAAETLSWAGSVAFGFPPVPDCATGESIAATDFSGNPAFTAGPADFNLDYLGNNIPVEDFTVTGSFDTGGAGLLDLQATGRIDTRPLDAILGFDTCLLVLAFGDVCIPCDDGQVACLDALATAPSAAWDASIDVIGTCGL